MDSRRRNQPEECTRCGEFIDVKNDVHRLGGNPYHKICYDTELMVSATIRVVQCAMSKVDYNIARSVIQNATMVMNRLVDVEEQKIEDAIGRLELDATPVNPRDNSQAKEKRQRDWYSTEVRDKRQRDW